MDALSATGLSGLRAASTRMDVAAFDIANAETPGFRRQQAVLATATPGVSASVVRDAAPTEDVGVQPEDVVGLLAAKNAFLANLAVFRTGNQVTGTLLQAVA
jgi:flagellar hook protein FlgE